MPSGENSAEGRTALAKLTLMARFSLLLDKADDQQIDEGLRGGAELKGATLWILMLAILIASIGLNTNSTAVIIGAMLVSPLMGPIMGIGYGVGIYDFDLVKKSFINLGVATAISLCASTIYFALSPLTGEQSELLARTSPTIWDVQIALFGGLAGIIGATRKEKTTVIPGVAIATALMPPLCTAGFGLASGNWQYFFGAFYLFAINSVFIALAAVAVVRMIGLPHRTYVDKVVQSKVRHLLLAVALLTALPSVYLATRLVREELFSARARAFVTREFSFSGTHVLATGVDPKKRQITVTLVGDTVEQTTIQDIRARLGQTGLSGTTFKVYQTREPAVALAAAQGGGDKAMALATRQALEEQQDTLARLRQKLDSQSAPWMDAAPDMEREMAAQWPELKNVVIGAGRTTEAGPEAAPDTALLSAQLSARLAPKDVTRLEAWFQARTKAPAVRLMIDHKPAPRKARRA
ncbi:MAG: TIGR00341 family protein [Humidesulfovibrio sp.]|uniref:TIGR00341 family protein n=1 Tax=Humidesulfovibrio sp. TaxID=2910988 RepID=UPI0027348575|nr:TIGR00341 family protein [Humidesulfovibrio sp.]MDP2848790.1 TIGR00341 family protein [Humidesulfovibrio sp.]